VLAAMTDQQVYSLEHLTHYAATAHYWAGLADVHNLNIACAPLLEDHWYNLDAFDLPNKFALGFCDGPPRLFGTRHLFFERLASRCAVVLLDDVATDPLYQRDIHEYANSRGLQVTMLGRAAMLSQPDLLKAAA
jgi:hypothetical protein